MIKKMITKQNFILNMRHYCTTLETAIGTAMIKKRKPQSINKLQINENNN
jgi:hypothetical protein